MLIGGAAMTLVGRSVLLVEGARVARASAAAASRRRLRRALLRFQRGALVGAFLIGLSTFQAEFDFGVPQFDAAVRADAGHARGVRGAGRRPPVGGAAAARCSPWALFVAVRGGVSLLVGPVFGETTPALPALRGRGGARRAGRAARPGRATAGLRRRCGRADRHRRPGCRVGLVACLDADRLAGVDARPRRSPSACPRPSRAA